jgi:hypothetical protein
VSGTHVGIARARSSAHAHRGPADAPLRARSIRVARDGTEFPSPPRAGEKVAGGRMRGFEHEDNGPSPGTACHPLPLRGRGFESGRAQGEIRCSRQPVLITVRDPDGNRSRLHDQRMDRSLGSARTGSWIVPSRRPRASPPRAPPKMLRPPRHRSHTIPTSGTRSQKRMIGTGTPGGGGSRTRGTMPRSGRRGRGHQIDPCEIVPGRAHDVAPARALGTVLVRPLRRRCDGGRRTSLIHP